MKIPKIHGKHKIRDTKICRLWVEDSISTEEISERFELTSRRINQILYDNRNFLQLDIDHEKNKRLHNLNKWMKSADNPKSNKLTLQQEIRREIEGETPLIDQSQHTHILSVIQQIHGITQKEEKIESDNRIKDYAGAGIEIAE